MPSCRLFDSLWLLWFLLTAASGEPHGPNPKYPVVLLPGIAASVLDAKLNRTQTAAWYCTRTADWRVVYFSFREALSPLCLCDELMVHYDEANNQPAVMISRTTPNNMLAAISRMHVLIRFVDQPGVQIRPHDFGGLNGIRALDPSDQKLTPTYLPLIKGLEAAGYVERLNLWGGPYDWRLAADGLAARGAADGMQALIEMAVSTAGGKPAVIIAHSMGNLVLGYFLKLWGPEWARKHIHYVVAASGPWGGAVKSIKGTVSGENFGLPIPHDLLHSLQGIAPSGPWLFPSEEVWPPDDIIDIGSTELAKSWPKLKSTHDGQLQEGTIPVPLLCAFGNGLDTDESYIYSVAHLNQSTAPEPNKIQSKNGDGTVNSRSLRACAQVGPKNATSVLELPEVSHLGVLSARPFLHRLAHILEVPGVDLVTGVEAIGEEQFDEPLNSAVDAGSVLQTVGE